MLWAGLICALLASSAAALSMQEPKKATTTPRQRLDRLQQFQSNNVIGSEHWFLCNDRFDCGRANVQTLENVQSLGH
jgi:hypothetical protein